MQIQTQRSFVNPNDSASSPPTSNPIQCSGALVSSAAKGIAADRIVPQRYRLQSLSPQASRGKTSNAMIVDSTAGAIDTKTGAPRGMYVIRSDAPHKGSPTHHLNLNPKLTNFKDPHLPISSAAYAASGITARAFDAVSRIARPAAVAVDAGRVGYALAQDEGKVGEHTIPTLGSVAGEWSGSVLGAWGGAQLGTLAGGEVGSLFGGVGAVPGAALGGVVGGIAGGIAGALGGSWAGEHAAADLIQRKE